MSKKVDLVGYWNGSVESPEISFKIPSEKELKTWRLCNISIEEVVNADTGRDLGNIGKVRRQNRKLIKAINGLKNIKI